MKDHNAPATPAKSKFDEIALVCRKCLKRQGIKPKAFHRRIKACLAHGDGRGKLRVVETGCLGPCPKRGLAVATAASILERRILLIHPDASTAVIHDALLPEFGPKPGISARSYDAVAPNRRV